MAKYKYYVVWKGRKSGIYETWPECDSQVRDYTGAKFKGFANRKSAEVALKRSYKDYYKKKVSTRKIRKSRSKPVVFTDKIMDSISVDGACDISTGVVEFQGVHTSTKEVIFKAGPFKDGTNNIAEFLAIVEGIKYCESNNFSIPIYSDSQTALSWIRRKSANSKCPRNDSNRELYKLFDDALEWLKQNDFDNKILKWETKDWGENPADFGRK